ncbi:hypothetical protein [Dongia sp. agr-C8]
MIAKAVIGVLAAIVLVLLYQGMRHERARVDPLAPIDNKKIFATLRAQDYRCDAVDSFTPLGETESGQWDAYLVRCREGGRYLYFESRPKGRVDAMSCQEQSFKYAYRCPE